MKKYFTLLLAAATLFCGCKNGGEEYVEQFIDVTPTNIAGVWSLQSYDGGVTLAPGSYVYIEFVRSDRTFTLYQNIGSMGCEVKTGNYYIETDPLLGAIIRGNYTAGDYNYADWAHRYIVEMTEDTMRWTAKDNPEDFSVYIRIPELPAL